MAVDMITRRGSNGIWGHHCNVSITQFALQIIRKYIPINESHRLGHGKFSFPSKNIPTICIAKTGQLTHMGAFEPIKTKKLINSGTINSQKN